MNRPFRDITKYFWGYLKEFRWFFYTILFGLLALAGSLWICESRVDMTTATDRVPPSGEESVPPAPAPGGTSSDAVQNLPAGASITNIHHQLQEILQQLRENSYALARTNQEVSKQFGNQAAQIEALDDRLQSLLIYWKRLDESRRVGINSLYYTWIAMLGSDFGAQTLGGKIVVAVAELWGVLTFGMLTALLVAAVKRYYSDK